MERPKSNHISEEDVKLIINKYGYDSNEVSIDSFTVENASKTMLGFLCDYLKLRVQVSSENDERKLCYFFIKAVSKTNTAKARMVKELNLLQKEMFFYSVLKEKMKVRGLLPWSARFVTALDEALVFEDLNALQYKLRNKFERFDTPHTLRALESLARFHASSIILEEKMSQVLGRTYNIQEQYDQFLDNGAYVENDVWFQQCMLGALETIKMFSKHGSQPYLKQIIKKWKDIWVSAVSISNISSKYRNVLCHRDLWNNNMLFRYEKDGENLLPNHCVMVDFQAVRCQPAAADVMLLLYCNLDPKFREQHMSTFLNYYYKELKVILEINSISIDNIMNNAQFIESTEEHRLWALIICACLIPQFWIEDDLTTKTFNDTNKFHDILTIDKGSFIINMMKINTDYKEKVLEIFDEIVERFCI